MASLPDVILKQVADKIKSNNNKNVKGNLKHAVKYLEECLNAQIAAYYRSYKPTVYQRGSSGGNLRRSVYAEDFMSARVVGNKLVLYVTFNENAMHRNIFGDHYSYVPILINFGWHSRKLEATEGRRYRYTVYYGFHMVEKAVKIFNATNKYGVHIGRDDIIATWNGQPVDSSYYRW